MVSQARTFLVYLLVYLYCSLQINDVFDFRLSR
jgi:hypothetical protein